MDTQGDDASSPLAAPPGERIGGGRVADVFAWGDCALKLYRAGVAKSVAFAEAAILAIVESHGLPAPGVHHVLRHGDRWGLVMDRLNGPTLGAEILSDPSRLDGAIAELVRLQLLLHDTVETRLRPLKARLRENVSRAPRLDVDLRTALQARLDGLPDGDRICHGDFHPMNVIATPGGSMIVDWPDATTGPPAADACRTYLLIRASAPDLSEVWLARYLACTGTAGTEVRDWLPVVAAARLAERIGGEEDALVALAGAL